MNVPSSSFKRATVASVLLLCACTTTKLPSSSDATAVETALTLLLVDNAAKVDPDIPKWWTETQRTETIKRGLSELRKFLDSVTAAQIEDRLLFNLSTDGEHSVPAEFSTADRRLTLRPDRKPNRLTVNIERGTEQSLAMFFAANYQWVFKLTVDSAQKTNLLFRGPMCVDFLPPVPPQPAILEIPRPTF